MKRKMIFAVGLIMMTTAVGNAAKHTSDDITGYVKYVVNKPFGIFIDLRVRYNNPIASKGGV